MKNKSERIKALLLSGASTQDIITETGACKATISYHATAIGLQRQRPRIEKPDLIDRRVKYDWKIIQEYYDLGNSLRDCIEHFGCAHMTITKAVRRGDLRTRRKSKTPLNGVLTEKSTYNRCHLKQRLIANGILPNTCSNCSPLPTWDGKPLVLVLDHINGTNNDNRLENLRLLCPNCNSQTDTFAGRNTKKVKKLDPANPAPLLGDLDE